MHTGTCRQHCLVWGSCRSQKLSLSLIQLGIRVMWAYQSRPALTAEYVWFSILFWNSILKTQLILMWHCDTDIILKVYWDNEIHGLQKDKAVVSLLIFWSNSTNLFCHRLISYYSFMDYNRFQFKSLPRNYPLGETLSPILYPYLSFCLWKMMDKEYGLTFILLMKIPTYSYMI